MIVDLTAAKKPIKDVTQRNDKCARTLMDFYTKYAIIKAEMENKEFKKLSEYKQEAIAKELVLDLLNEVKDEIKRVLKINPSFIYTDYFDKLASLLDVLHKLRTL